MKQPETQPRSRKTERVVSSLCYAALPILFMLFLALSVVPLLRLPMTGAADAGRLIADRGLLGALFLALGFVCVLLPRRLLRDTVGTPDSLMYSLIFLIVRVWLGKRQRVILDGELLKEAKAPYILLSNHESFEDFYYISQLPHPRRPSYLVNEYYCTRPVLKTMAKRGGILSKKLFTRDMSTGVSILRMLKKGFPVVIFPEGRLSPDGRSNPIAEPGGALYRRLGVDLMLVKLEGAYYAHPKWRKTKYRSRIRVSVRRVLHPRELEAMGADELDALIARELYQDDSKLVYAEFPQKDRAAGLDTLLYRCADCGALYETESAGDALRCRACGRQHRLDERYHFTDAPWTIPGYYDEIRRMEAEQLDSLLLRCEVRTKIFGENGGPVRWESGECELDARSFRYRSGNRSFEIPAEKLPALAFSCGEEFELYHENELHYFYPARTPKQAARWALAVDLLAERRREAADMKGDTDNGKQ